MKNALANASLLVHPTPDAPTSIMTDASDVAVGAVLQQYIKEQWCPLAFFSRTLKSAETRYSTYDRELLAIYLAIKHFRKPKPSFRLGFPGLEYPQPSQRIVVGSLSHIYERHSLTYWKHSTPELRTSPSLWISPLWLLLPLLHLHLLVLHLLPPNPPRSPNVLRGQVVEYTGRHISEISLRSKSLQWE